MSWFKFNNLGLALGANLKLYTSLSKGLKLKVRKFWVLTPTFVEATREKLVGGGGFLSPILSRVNDMLSKSSDATFHVKHIQELGIESCKYFYGLSAPVMKTAFTKIILKCNLWSSKVTLLPNTKIEKYCFDTVSYKATQLWGTPPAMYRSLPLLDLLKSKMKGWHFFDGVGFTNSNWGQSPRCVLINRSVFWLCLRSVSRMSVARCLFR